MSFDYLDAQLEVTPCPTCKAGPGEPCEGDPHPVLGVGFCQLRVALVDRAIDDAMMFRARARNWFEPFPPRGQRLPMRQLELFA